MRQRMAENNNQTKKGTPFNDLKESEQMQIAEQFKNLTQYELRLYRWMKASNGDGWVLTNPFEVPLHTARMKL
jgi:hypothetical protein